MQAKIKFLGIASFEIYTSGGKTVLIDPYLNESPVSPIKAGGIDPVDLILVSHGASDHVGDTAEIALKYNSRVICGSEVGMLLCEQGVPKANITETTWGVMVEQCGIRVRPVESHHRSTVTLKDGRVISGVPLGFMIYLEDGVRIYNSSDTAIFSDLKLFGELYKPHIGFLNVTYPELDPTIPDLIGSSLSGEMSPYEAALAAQWLNLDYAIACHYTSKDSPDVQQFMKLLTEMRTEAAPFVKPIALAPGEEFVYSRADR